MLLAKSIRVRTIEEKLACIMSIQQITHKHYLIYRKGNDTNGDLFVKSYL